MHSQIMSNFEINLMKTFDQKFQWILHLSYSDKKTFSIVNNLFFKTYFLPKRKIKEKRNLGRKHYKKQQLNLVLRENVNNCANELHHPFTFIF